MTTLEARALSALESYLDLAPGPRAKALALLRAADPELHAEIVRLLEADALQDVLAQSPQDILAEAGAAGFADDAHPQDDPRLGSMLGSWRIDALLGAGGMGKVYRASRADGQYAQTVAIKCAGTEIDSPALADAIRNERNTLAQLEHPNISTLLDGGIDRDGYPWLAMQLVNGQPLDRWCDQHRLPLRGRVELFSRLCDGLAYAHGKDVLHSDIKPSNILVDTTGRPVLLDFGLSSLVLPEQPAGRRQVAITPDYTAPEIASDGYSVRTDIYALGIVLYGLLCGQTPSRRLPMGPGATLPALPSRVAAEGSPETARARALSSPTELARALSGDLDAIVMKCVARDPEQRYASVAQLQVDLRNWLGGAPVSVRRGEPAYRTALFFRRHPIATVASVLVIVGIVGGLWATHRLRDQAAQHASAAQAMRRLLDESLNIVTTSSLGRSSLASRDMLASAEAKLGNSEVVRDPQIHTYALLALARSYTTLGDYRHAMKLVERARTLSADEPVQVPALNAAYAHLSNEQSRYAQGRDAALAGLTKIEDAPKADRDDARLALESELARAQWGMGQIRSATSTLDGAITKASALAGRSPDALATLLIQRGQWQVELGKDDNARKDFEQALKISEASGSSVADSARFELVGVYRGPEERSRALRTAETLLASRRRALGETHPETGKAWVTLANAQLWANSKEQAPASARRGEEILINALGPSHPEVAEAMQVISAFDAQTGRQREAIASARRALDIMHKAHGNRHPRTLGAMRHLAAVLAVNADQPQSDGKGWDEVISLYEQINQIGREQGLPMLWTRGRELKAKMRVNRIDPDTGRQLQQLIAETDKAEGRNSDASRGTRFLLVEMYMLQKKYDSAEPLLREMLREFDSAEQTLSAQGERSHVHHVLGDIALAKGDKEMARREWQQAKTFALQAGGPATGPVQVLDTKLASLQRSQRSQNASAAAP